MCKRCLDLCEQYFPGLSEEEQGDLLMGATAFPICGPEYLEGQLQAIARRRELHGFPSDWIGRELALADAQISSFFEVERLQKEDWQYA